MEIFKKDLEIKLEKVNHFIENEYNQIVAGGAHPSILSKIRVEYYGELQPIKNIANISVQDYENLVISPYEIDFIKEIAKAISHSTLELNPQIEGKIVRIHVPRVTEERRKELVKKAKEILEEAKIKVRNIRKEINTKIKNDKELSENEQELYSDQIQKIIDNFNKNLDDIFKNKEIQLLKV